MTVTLAQPLPTLIARGDLRHITQPQPTPAKGAVRGRVPIRAAAKPPKPGVLGRWTITDTDTGPAMSFGDEHVALPCGLIVADAIAVASFPIREFAGRRDAPEGRWLALSDNGRVYWQSCDGHVLSTFPGPNEHNPYVNWTVGWHAWILTDIRPIDVREKIGAAACND